MKIIKNIVNIVNIIVFIPVLIISFIPVFGYALIKSFTGQTFGQSLSKVKCFLDRLKYRESVVPLNKVGR